MWIFVVTIHRYIVSGKRKQSRRVSGGPEFAANLLIIPDGNPSQPMPSVNNLSRSRDVLIAEFHQNTRQTSSTILGSLNNHQISNVASSGIPLTVYEDMHHDNSGCSGNELHFYASTCDMSTINKSYSPHRHAGNTDNSLDTRECLYNEIPPENIPPNSSKINRPLPQRPSRTTDLNCNQTSPTHASPEVAYTSNTFTSCLDSVGNKPSQERLNSSLNQSRPMFGNSDVLSESEYASLTETNSSELGILASSSSPAWLSSRNSKIYSTIPDNISPKRQLQLHADSKHDSLYFTLESKKPSQGQNDRIDKTYQDETFNQRSPLPDEMIDNPLYNPFEQDR